jgi:hypothetical protein
MDSKEAEKEEMRDEAHDIEDEEQYKLDESEEEEESEEE